MTTRPASSVSQRPACEIVPRGEAATTAGADVVGVDAFGLDASELHAATPTIATTVAATIVARALGIGRDRTRHRPHPHGGLAGATIVT